MHPSAPRTRAMAAAALVVLALAPACKKKPPPPPALPPPVESPLKLVSVTPSVVAPNAAADVTVFGSGFDREMTLRVGDEPVTDLTYLNDNQVKASLPPLDPGVYDLTAVSASLGSSDVLRGGLVVERIDNTTACQFVVLYFETDRSMLNASAETTLSSVVECFGARADPIRVEGHADERGTTDYNLALSYRRALSVQGYLQAAGIAKDRLPVSSFGEERPAVSGWGEGAWAQNRRVELTFDIR
jgi:outer membrane protein OmpA-like peptidoglycan-associated protein